ncbi:MAG: CYTH domain-containing protein [Candidatus Abyssobacteria bacterium SURF_5]|uniref:CYTH domain-containing protein n=1 Tax=Abyssobacteria bacterium (strain SURF_5) TaxID=2093360 RepID=A0A3A4NWE9_ABYX5|nr:MAG: CYTH domain-containing protein [Candidatus Abyssubacteria bacterium SURF_5]
MPSNIEIKARVREHDAFRRIATRMATEPPQTLHQEDVFFRVRKGRLKLRIFSDGSGELIQYERPDLTGAKQSHYRIYRTSRPLELRKLLAEALDETVAVKKKREVYIAGQTRIHLDEVDKLGTFVELEVVLSPHQTVEEGQRLASDLMRKLGIKESDLVPCAYADLLENQVKQARKEGVSHPPVNWRKQEESS